MRSTVILAGGRSTRIGMDKCTVLFHGKPMIHWPVNTLKEITDEVIISVSKDKDVTLLRNYFMDEVRFVNDEMPHRGPLGGIISCFKEAMGEYIAVAPCDSPLILSELYQTLFELAEGSDGAVPRVNGLWEPLHGVYKRASMISAVKKILNEGKGRPIETFEHLTIKELSENEIMKIDPNLASFVNINELSDLQKASGLLKKMKI